MKTIDQVAEEIHKDKGRKQQIKYLPSIIQLAYRGCDLLNRTGDNLSIESSNSNIMNRKQLVYRCEITDRVAPKITVYCDYIDDNTAAITIVVIK